MRTFQPGEWVIHEGSVKIVKDVHHYDDDVSYGVSDGSFETSGRRLELFPLTLSNKAFGESVMSWAKIARYGYEYESRRGDAGLNHPDINRAYCALHDRCLSIPEGDTEARRAVVDEARDLARKIRDGVSEARRIEVGGISLFK